MQLQKSMHSPTLDTILMVEQALQESGNGVMTVADLKRALPRQVNHQTLMTILYYLEDSGKLAASLKGMTWLGNTGNPLLRKGIKSGRRI